ncbi:MAG: gliding motility-associated C-terminal domain-containing protein, partial [Cyclobacteriaceae bacterium]
PSGPYTSNAVNITVRPATDPACTGGAGCGAFIVNVVPVRPPCNLPDNGSLTFNISGGSGSYQLILTGDSGFNQGELGVAGTPILFEDLSAGDYTYTITDTNGNTCTLPFTLENETIIDAAVTNVVDSECYNEPDGEATIEILDGGNPPYEYSLDGILWNQALTSVFTVSGLSAADSPIGILIRDDASDVCPEEVFVTINNLYPEIITPVETTPVTTCDGNEGSLTVTYPPTGGNSPNNIWEIAVEPGNILTGNFKPFTADEVVNDLTAGSYSVFIRDEGGCVKRIPVTVEAPNQVDLVATAVAADCSNDGRSGGLQIQVNNTIEVPGPYRLTIEALSGAQAGEVVYEDLNYNGQFIELETLVSATYLIVAIPSDPDLCPVEVERTISGGPQPVFFDYQLTCSGGSNLKQLLLTDIAGDPNTPFTLQVFDNLSSQLEEEINFTLNIGNQYLIENYFFLTTNKEYRLRLVQRPGICTGQEVRYEHPENLIIPAPLMAAIGETTKSLPDRATGSLQVINFVGGYQPDDNEFPYLIAIELDSASVPGQNYSTDFDTVRLNSNLDFEKVYEDIPAGRYRVFVTDQQGCTIELTARVPLDTDIFIPNIFTPNGDGSNETFFIRNKPDADVKLLITNRWGKRVFTSDDYQNNWDGGDAPDGVYYYHIQADGQEYKGWVEILRNIAP